MGYTNKQSNLEIHELFITRGLNNQTKERLYKIYPLLKEAIYKNKLLKFGDRFKLSLLSSSYTTFNNRDHKISLHINHQNLISYLVVSNENIEKLILLNFGSDFLCDGHSTKGMINKLIKGSGNFTEGLFSLGSIEDSILPFLNDNGDFAFFNSSNQLSIYGLNKNKTSGVYGFVGKIDILGDYSNYIPIRLFKKKKGLDIVYIDLNKFLSKLFLIKDINIGNEAPLFNVVFNHYKKSLSNKYIFSNQIDNTEDVFSIITTNKTHVFYYNRGKSGNVLDVKFKVISSGGVFNMCGFNVGSIVKDNGIYFAKETYREGNINIFQFFYSSEFAIKDTKYFDNIEIDEVDDIDNINDDFENDAEEFDEINSQSFFIIKNFNQITTIKGKFIKLLDGFVIYKGELDYIYIYNMNNRKNVGGLFLGNNNKVSLFNINGKNILLSTIKNVQNFEFEDDIDILKLNVLGNKNFQIILKNGSVLNNINLILENLSKGETGIKIGDIKCIANIENKRFVGYLITHENIQQFSYKGNFIDFVNKLNKGEDLYIDLNSLF